MRGMMALAIVAMAAMPAFAAPRPDDELAEARRAAAAHHVTHATFWVAGRRLVAQRWDAPRPEGWTMAEAAALRGVLAHRRGLRSSQPWGHGEAGGITYTYAGGLVITASTPLNHRTMQYDHVSALFAAPVGVEEFALADRKDLTAVGMK